MRILKFSFASLKMSLVIIVCMVMPHLQWTALSAITVDTLEDDQLEHWETYNWEDKLKRSATNIWTAPGEIPYWIQRTSVERNKKQGWSYGLLKGVGKAFVRFGAGWVELFTFPFAFPDDEMAPIMEPAYLKDRPKIVEAK